ncbi:hypothetical protein J3F84DRAFT_276951 [Trichoderma pleuroticola]
MRPETKGSSCVAGLDLCSHIRVGFTSIYSRPLVVHSAGREHFCRQINSSRGGAGNVCADVVEMRGHEPCSGRSEWLFFPGWEQEKTSIISFQLCQGALCERGNRRGDYQAQCLTRAGCYHWMSYIEREAHSGGQKVVFMGLATTWFLVPWPLLRLGRRYSVPLSLIHYISARTTCGSTTASPSLMLRNHKSILRLGSRATRRAGWGQVATFKVGAIVRAGPEREWRVPTRYGVLGYVHSSTTAHC